MSMYGPNGTAPANSSLTIGEKCFFLERSRHYEGFLYIESVLTAVVNLVCAVIATSANAVIVLTIRKSSQLHTPAYVLLGCLALADFTTGLIVQPTYFVSKLASFLGKGDLSCASRLVLECVAWLSAAVSCMSYAAISGERYLALHFHLKYAQIVTTKRALLFVTYCWTVPAILSLSRFALTNLHPFIILNIVGLSSATVTTLLAYWKIYWLVRYHHRKINDQARATTEGELDMRQFRKSINYLAFLVAVFVFLYVPFTCALVAYACLGFTAEVEAAYDVTRTCAFLASTINPFLYCWKMTDLREAVLDFIHQRSGNVNTPGVAFHTNRSMNDDSVDISRY